MTVSRNVLLTWLVVTVALSVGLLDIVRWPSWVALPIAVVIAVVGLTLTARRSSSSALAATPAPVMMTVPSPPPAEYQSQTVTDIPVPSCRPDYCYVFSATVRWQPIDTSAHNDAAGLGDLAVTEIVRRARELTQRSDPADRSLIWMEVVMTLAEARADTQGRMRTKATAIQLTIPDQDQQRLDRLAALRKDEEVYDHQRRSEQSKREYISTDVLKDPGAGVVWWLARNEDDPAKAADSIGVFTQLYHAVNGIAPANEKASFKDSPAPPGSAGSAANASGAPDQPTTSHAARFDAFTSALGFEPGTQQHRLLNDQVASLVAGHGHAAAADELTRRYNATSDSTAFGDVPGFPPRGDGESVGD
jgi:hypothetical protein